MSQGTLTQIELANKPIESGTGIEIKILDDKIIICAENKMRIREGNFLLQGEEIIIEAGRGIKISSRHPNILVIETNLTKIEEKVYDLQKSMDERLKVIESVFSKILKQIKQ